MALVGLDGFGRSDRRVRPNELAATLRAMNSSNRKVAQLVCPSASCRLRTSSVRLLLDTKCLQQFNDFPVVFAVKAGILVGTGQPVPGALSAPSVLAPRPTRIGIIRFCRVTTAVVSGVEP